MSDLRALLQQHTGLSLSAADVERALRERAAIRPGADTGTGHPACAPAPGTPEFDALLELLVVPESWMLRDPAVFLHALRFVQRRLLAQPDRQLRILSLPCAGGEEPYSMALLLADAGVTPAQCRIDAVDLSRTAIERARQGRYTNNAFRGADLAFRARWFTLEDDRYAIAPGLRDYVCFSQGNLFALLGNVAGRRYDLVFCRNLLIYFDADACARAASALAALLAEDGELLSGYAEAPTLCTHGFGTTSLRTPFALARNVPALRWRPTSPLPPRPVPAAGAGPRRSAMAPPAAPDATPATGAIAALLAQARRDADAGRVAQATAACEALLRDAPTCAEAYYLLGLLNECGSRDLAAQSHWRRCLYLDPAHYDALCGLALLHERRGDAAMAAALRGRAARVYARRGMEES
jgi:chemotaxis protein methyltransferase WspC